MADAEVSKLLQTLIGEELKVVSFKWLARQQGLTAAAAKQQLALYAKAHGKGVKVTYLLAGTTKEQPARHVVLLVPGEQLKEKRDGLDTETTLHVYSLQPAQLKDPAELWNRDHLQAAELLASALQQREPNALIANSCSTIQCEAAKWAVLQRAAAPAPAATPAAQPAKTKATAGIAAKINGIVSGSKADAPVEDGKAGSSQPEKPAAPRQNRIERPSAATGRSGSGSGSGAGGAAKLKAAWSKAKPASKPAAGKAKAPAAKKGPASKAAKAASEAEADSDSEEDAVPVQRRSQVKTVQVLDDSDDEGDIEIDLSVPNGNKRGAAKELSSAQKRRRTLLEDSDDEESEGGFGTTGDPQAAAAGAEQPAEEDGEEQAPQKEKKAPAKRARKPKAAANPGTVKAGEATTQPGKRRVLKTTYNDKGEEVTEMVLEDDPNWQAPSQQAALARAGSAAGSGQDPESPAAAKRPSSQGQGKAKPAAKKAASAKGAAKSSPAKAPAKGKGAKGKAAPAAGQRGIQSFFGKKG